MSGLEVVGLILAVFPLMISGMEHYEGTKNTAVTWWKIKRAHRRDCGKLDIVRLEYRFVIRDLLEPLVLDGTITQTKREALLEGPSGSSWLDADVQNAVEERLGTTKATFLEVVRELNQLLVGLAEATKVTDPHFQAVLKRNAVCLLVQRGRVCRVQ